MMNMGQNMMNLGQNMMNPNMMNMNMNMGQNMMNMKMLQQEFQTNLNKIQLFKELSKDFKLVIASNNIQKKVSKIADYLNCDYFDFDLLILIWIGILIYISLKTLF